MGCLRVLSSRPTPVQAWAAHDAASLVLTTVIVGCSRRLQIWVHGQAAQLRSLKKPGKILRRTKETLSAVQVGLCLLRRLPWRLWAPTWQTRGASTLVRTLLVVDNYVDSNLAQRTHASLLRAYTARLVVVACRKRGVCCSISACRVKHVS